MSDWCGTCREERYCQNMPAASAVVEPSGCCLEPGHEGPHMALVTWPTTEQRFVEAMGHLFSGHELVAFLRACADAFEAKELGK